MPLINIANSWPADTIAISQRIAARSDYSMPDFTPLAFSLLSFHAISAMRCQMLPLLHFLLTLH